MRPGDVDQATEIDHEAFPTQWPPPNYKRELQSSLSRYIVAIDDTPTSPGIAEPQTIISPHTKYGEQRLE